MNFNAVYYEPGILEYELGCYLKDKYSNLPWYPIETHNKIDEMRSKENKDFPKMKQNLIIGTRKTHKFVENQKISDYLVPYTSSGCSAMCLYCYLVCNYNKCAYLRLFVNREKMLSKIIKTAENSIKNLTFEIGSNSDLILENTITHNLEWTINNFSKSKKGFITFPTKFSYVEPLLPLEHKGKVIFRMSVNPSEIIKKVEFGTSPLEDRIKAINLMTEAGYRTGILIAPIVLIDNWQEYYKNLITRLADELSQKTKSGLMIEIIFMTYSSIHRYINNEAFPNAVELYNQELMRGRARGKYGYKNDVRAHAESILVSEIKEKLPKAKIIYIC